MNSADRTWQTFLIKDIFEIKPVRGLPIEKYKGGNYPYITTSAENNGLTTFVEAFDDAISKRGCISVDPIKGKTFYHDYNFVGRGFSGASINLLYNENLNKYNGLFICQLIEATSKNKASYGNLFNSYRLRDNKILLPIDTDGNPDWDFMTDYMKQQEQAILAKYKTYLTAIERERERERVEATSGRKWAEFSIDEIFNIKAGKRLTKASMVSGRTPFIGASDSNNGVTAFISNDNASRDNNILGVNYNGSVVETFYHPYECLFSDDVKRFSLKNYDGNKYVYLFLKSVIIKQKEKYQYGYKFNESRMLRQKIMLPVTIGGEPDYEYMEKSAKYTEAKLLARYVAYLDSRSTSYHK